MTADALRSLVATAVRRLAVAVGSGLVVASVLAVQDVQREGWVELAGWWRLGVLRLWRHADRWIPLLAAGALLATVATAVRRRPLRVKPSTRLAVAFLLVVMALRLGSAVGLPVRGRPNLLLVSIDTLRADRLGVYGHTRPTSPFLDATLGATGVTFERVFSNAPKTTPAHMSMLTSLPPCAHGVLMWEGSEARAALAPRVHTLAEILRAAGYATAAFTAGGPMDRSRGFDHGFEVYRHGRQLERTIAWLERRPRGRPFFLFFHTFEVHDPYAPPPVQIARFLPDYRGPLLEAVAAVRSGRGGWQRAHRTFWDAVDRDDPLTVDAVSRLYDGAIREMDDTTLTTLLGRLDRLGLAANTLVVVTSDHGEAFGEHGVFLHDDLYEGTLRVPLVLRWPGRLPAGKRITEPADLLDVVPTLLDLLRIPPPPDLQGRSFAAAVLGTGPAPTAVPIVSEHASATTGWRAESVRLGAWSFLEVGGVPLLFDLATDPGEHRNLAAHRPETVAALRALLEHRRVGCVRLAARYGPRGPGVAPSADALERLRALGYVE